MPLVIGALPLIILAVVGMIVLWGLALLLKSVLQSLANHVPVIGGPLGAAIGSIIDQAVALGAAAARAVVGEAVGLILSPVYWIERHISAVINFFTGLVSAISYITKTLIPGVVSTLQADILTAYHDAIAYVQAVANLIYAAIAYDVTALEQALTAAESALAHYAQQLTAAAEAYTTAAINTETTFVINTATALEHEVTAVAQAESAYAQALYTDAITYSATLVTTAETALITDIGNVVTWTEQQVSGLDAAIGAMGAGVLAQALTAVATVADDLADLESECTDSLCSGLSDLASLFNDLQAGLGLTALFALAAEFAADPRQAAADVHDVLAPLATDAAGAVRDLIGM